MNAPDPNIIAHNCGKRLRKLAESTEWSSRKMRPLRTLFGEFAEYGNANTNNLRQLVELVGVRPSDRQALQGLAAEHVPLIWRGYYGANIPDLRQGGRES